MRLLHAQPDFNGGIVAPASAADGMEDIDNPLGADDVMNQWSVMPANGVGADWVIALPVK